MIATVLILSLDLGAIQNVSNEEVGTNFAILSYIYASLFAQISHN